MKQILTNMFGFMWSQPWTKTLRQTRIISVGFVIFSTWLIYEIWLTIKPAIADNPADAWPFLLALLAGTWKAISSFAEAHKDDD